MKTITVEASVHAPLEKVWEAWTTPEHIMKWNHASEDWECPYAENDVHVGGKFLSRMSAKNGSTSFDFNGIYSEIIPLSRIAYTIEDGRTVSVTFEEKDGVTHLSETFEMENENTEEKQHEGWQSILINFKEYTERLTS